MNLVFGEEAYLSDALKEEFERAALAIFELEDINDEVCEISVSLVEPDEIRKLNAQYRGKDKATDVLSFPQIEDFAAEQNPGLLMLGDVVICPKVAADHAAEYGHTKEHELVYLFVHSVLHLLGYDHMEYESKKLMRRAEKSILIALGYETEDGLRVSP